MLGGGDARQHEDAHRGDVGKQHGGSHVHDDAGQDGGDRLRGHAHGVVVARVAADAVGAAALQDHGVDAQVDSAQGHAHEEEHQVERGREAQGQPQDDGAGDHDRVGHALLSAGLGGVVEVDLVLVDSQFAYA